jgi:hypothetical protein
MSRRRFALTSVGATALLAGGVVTLEGCNATQWIQIALNDLPTIVQIALSIVNMVGAFAGGADPAIVTKTQSVAAQVQTDLQTAQSLIQEYQANASTTLLSKINAAMTAAKDNLAAILTTFHIMDPVKQSEISAGVAAAIAAVTYLESLIPTPAVPAQAKLKAAAVSNANYMKSAFNVAVVAAGGSRFAI